MSPQPTALSCTACNEPWGVLLKVTGPASTDQVRELQIATIKVVAGRVKLAVLDLSELTFISSLAMGTLVSLRRDLGRWGGQVRLAGVPSMILEALECARLTQIIPCHTTLDEALTAAQTA